MRHHLSLEQARGLVVSRTALRRDRWTERQIAAAVRGGALRRLQRGRYVRSAEWDALWPESRHLLEVTAAFAEMNGGNSVASYESAAVIWGLPLFRHEPPAVHVTIPGGKHVASRAGLRRHHDVLPDEDVAFRGAFRVTALDRTVFDLARTLSFETAVAAADAALRVVAFAAREYDLAAAAAWRERMRRRVAGSGGVRGVRQAAQVIEFADGRSESPAESVARVQAARLGFARIGLQIPVPSPHGTLWWVDLELEEVGAFLEIDGIGKYDEALRSGRTLQEVLLAEKRREDWIRGTTGKQLVRAEPQHVRTPEALAERLASFHIRLPR
ncbi:hypothetical protein ACFQ0P_10195 [Microbacterium insulae]|uniref:Transcriptional regulator, AbiEi antitoxin, Type IV TA system n=1 Tax=Microbacterium insulae TaxID=483014 RepID=A0ABW3AIG5_9MICO